MAQAIGLVVSQFGVAANLAFSYTNRQPAAPALRSPDPIYELLASCSGESFVAI